MPPSEMTATSDVPPPMSTTMLPVGSPTGRPGADRGGHRLLDQVGLAGAGGQARLLDRALLHPGDARGHAHDHARMRPAVLVHLLDEVAEHLLRHVEVGDHAVLERADGRDRPGRAAEHPLRLDADGVDLARARVDRHHGGLRQHDPAAAHVDERVRRAEVDRHVAAAEAGEVGEETHGKRRPPGGSDDRGRAGRGSLSKPYGPENVLQSGAGEEVEQAREGQPDHVQVVAGDAADERRAAPLDGVAARPAAPFARVRRRPPPPPRTERPEATPR